jgi:lipoprotein signal peptidase
MYLEIAAVFFLIALDQLSKFVFGDVVTLNTGISFGIGSTEIGSTGGDAVALALLAIKSIILIVLCGYRWHAYWLSRDPGRLSWWVLFMAGGVSNLLDRALWGGVRDWLPIPFVGLTNNFADWYIALAGMIILVDLIRKHDSSTPTNRSL